MVATPESPICSPYHWGHHLANDVPSEDEHVALQNLATFRNFLKHLSEAVDIGDEKILDFATVGRLLWG